MAGAGIKGGTVHGASDRWAAYPSRDPVTPADIAATIYHCLGVNPAAELIDSLSRPLALCLGDPVSGFCRDDSDQGPGDDEMVNRSSRVDAIRA